MNRRFNRTSERAKKISPIADNPENHISTAHNDFATFFTAACIGARYEDEREPLKTLYQKFKSLDNLKEEKDNLTPALTLADRYISAHSFQTSHLKAVDLQKLY